MKMYDCVSLRRNKVNSNGPNMFICKLIGHLQPKIPASKLIYSGCHLSSGLFVMSLGAIFLRSMASLRRKHCLRWLQKACKHFTTIRGFGFQPKKQCHWFWQKSFFGIILVPECLSSGLHAAAGGPRSASRPWRSPARESGTRGSRFRPPRSC